MFASQLLRILQTIPANGNHDAFPFDAAGTKATINVDQEQGLRELDNVYKKKDPDPLPSELHGFWNTPELECALVDDLSPTQQTVSCGKIDLFAEELDKNVVECELPELMVCYKESGYHVVKDIWIDEGGVGDEQQNNFVHFDDEVVLSSGERTSIDTHSSDDDDDDICDRVDGEFLISDLLMFSKGKVGNNNTSKNESETTATTEEERVDIEMELLLLDESVSPSNKGFDDNDNHVGGGIECEDPIDLMNPTGQRNSSSTDDDPHPLGREDFSGQDSPQSVLDSPDYNGNEVARLSVQALGADLMSSEAEGGSKRSNKCSYAELCYDSKVENGTITFDFKSTSGRLERSPDDVDRVDENLLESKDDDAVPNKYEEEDEICAAYTDGIQVIQRGPGETSFSSASVVSALISCTSPESISGNVSNRSDSSNTSNRSFAFPVYNLLQSEWGGSPQRMAKADRRQFRKLRCLRHGFLCCRF